MTKTRLSMAAACLSALLANTSAQAEQLLTWTFTGNVSGITNAYVRDADIQADIDRALANGLPPPSNAIYLHSAEQRATIDSVLAGYSTGHAFTATVTIDMDKPFNTAYAERGAGVMFPGAIKFNDLSIPGLNVLAHATHGLAEDLTLRDFGIVIKAGNEPATLAVTEPTVMAASISLGSRTVYFGSTTDLHELASPIMSYVPNFIFRGGSAVVAAPGCGIDNACGALQLSIRSMTVSAVPEPASWAMVAAGIAAMGVAGVRRRREQQR